MENPIIERILRQTETPRLLDVLADRLAPTDLQSLLLAVYHRRATRQAPSDVLRQFSDNRYLASARVDPVRALAFDQLAFSLLPEGYQGLDGYFPAFRGPGTTNAPG